MSHDGQSIDKINRMRTIILMIVMTTWNVDLITRKLVPMGAPPYTHGVEVGRI